MTWITEKMKFVIGMIHLDAIRGIRSDSLERVSADAEEAYWRLVSGGVDGICISNESDFPRTITVTQQEGQALEYITKRLRALSDIHLGVCILYNDWKLALTLAKACRLEFIRIDTFVDIMESDAGVIYPQAADIMALKQTLQLDCQLFTDIQVKHKRVLHNHPIEWSATQAYEQGSDGVILTGDTTGLPPPIAHVQKLRCLFKNEILLVGSGLSEKNCRDYYQYINGAFVGTALKTDGRIDVAKVKKLVALVRGC